MSLEFDYYSLGDLVKIKYGKNQKKVQDDENGKYPIYGTGGLMGYSIDYLYDKPSVLIGRKGSIEKVRYIEEPFWTVDTLFYTEVNEEIVIPKFLYYVMSLIDLSRYNEGTSIPSLRTETLNRLDIPIPNLDYQKRILTVLSNIDAKISINEEINRNLTELSHVLHKEFIKSIDNNGFCYYKEVKELGTIIMGQSPKGESYNYDNIGLPLINGAADYENGYLKAQKYTTDPKKTCDKNDLIFCIRATIGLLVICDKEYCLGRGVAGITNIDTLYKEYAFHLINSSIENFKRTATGSVISGISRKDIEEIPVRILTKDDMKKYHTIQKPIFDKLENNRIEIDNLIKLRDTLLPRLMSGEIDVSKINCDILQTSRKNCDNKFTLTLQNNLIEVIS